MNASEAIRHALTHKVTTEELDRALEALKSLEELEQSVTYALDQKPKAVRIREGGAFENLAASFAVNFREPA